MNAQMNPEFAKYLLRTGTETRVVELSTGLILDIRVNEYGVCSASGFSSDNVSYVSSVVNEDNFKHYPFITDYANLPENRAIFQLMFEEISRLRLNIREGLQNI
mgnify:CR=1 FL=1